MAAKIARLNSPALKPFPCSKFWLRCPSSQPSLIRRLRQTNWCLSLLVPQQLEKASGEDSATTASQLEAALDQELKATQPEKERTLKKEISDVSLDSAGFPKLLATPPHEKALEKAQADNSLVQPTFLRRRLGSKTKLEFTPQPTTLASLRGKLGYSDPKWGIKRTKL